MGPLKKIVRWFGSPKIPGYELFEPIASGPMSDIHRARNLKSERIVAVKILKTPGLKMRRAIRLKQPDLDRVIMSVEHPNVVKTYDFGCQGDKHYQIMDYINGVDLGSFEVRSKRFLMQILIGAAMGLYCLNSKYRLIFRDMNPNNVVIGPDNVPRLIDLDMAIQDTGDSTGFYRRTGTPGYMAPEQVTGSRLSARTDIYAWGATAYEVFTGFNPFRDQTGKTELKRQLRTYANHAKMRPAPPSTVRKDLPKKLDDVIMRCLSIVPEDRYPSFAELIEEASSIRL